MKNIVHAVSILSSGGEEGESETFVFLNLTEDGGGAAAAGNGEPAERSREKAILAPEFKARSAAGPAVAQTALPKPNRGNAAQDAKL